MSIKVSINRKQLLESIDRALVVKVSDKKPIVLDFNAGKVNLTMQTGTKSFNEDVACETGSNVIKIGVNPQYLLDALKVISDDEIHIEMANSNSPMFLTSENDTYKYVILPISM
jgi:DNA polymerase III sliding clamp (beta) subunit (PCNA family)